MHIFSNKTYFHPDVKDSIVITVLFFMVFGMLLSFLANLWFNAIWPGDESFVLKTMISYIITFIPPATYVLLKSHELETTDIEAGEDRYDRRRADLGMHPAVFYLCCAVLMAAMVVVTEPLSYFVRMPEGTEVYFEKLCSAGLLSYFTLAVLPAFMEEFFFRGVMLRGMLHHRSAYTAILFSAFLFAFIHLNLAQGISAFLMGCLFGWIYYRSGSLKATMLMHFTNNSIAYFMARESASSGKETLLQLLGDSWLYGIVYAVCCIVALLLIRLLYRRMS